MGASTTKHFKSRIEKLNNFAETIPNDKIKKEPMFFNCDFQYAYENDTFGYTNSA